VWAVGDSSLSATQTTLKQTLFTNPELIMMTSTADKTLIPFLVM
jgi:hypothetical protein